MCIFLNNQSVLNVMFKKKKWNTEGLSLLGAGADDKGGGGMKLMFYAKSAIKARADD